MSSEQNGCFIQMRSIIPYFNMKPIVRAGCFVVVFLMALLRTSIAQADGDPVALGIYRSLHSEVLGEDRTLQVHLPQGYESTEATYPVIFLFYSDWVDGYFAQLVNDLYHLSTDRIPPAILVGVPNVQRYRDLIPWPRSEDRAGEEGRADRFLHALREEIIPFVDAEYRTKPYRVLVGPQAAAVFGVYVLLEAPEIFQAFILNDPCRFDSIERSLCEDLATFASTPPARGKFFAISHDAADDRWDMGMVRSLGERFEENAVDGFRWRIDLDTAWPFFLAPLGTRTALMDLFQDYPLAVEEVTGWADIRSHYEELSESLDFTVDPPNLVLSLSSDRLVQTGNHEAALEVLDHLVAIHPSSLDGPWRLANLHRVMGDTAKAIQYYEECLRRDPNIVPARTWLERLRGGR